MSEETIQNVEDKHECKCGGIKGLVIFSLILSILAFAASVYSVANSITAHSHGKKVVISKQYDKGQSLEKAQETKKPMVVFFYTDWCGYCQRFAPTFHKVVKNRDIKKNVSVAYVNCEKPENRKHMEDYEVQGFPTVFVIDEAGKRTRLENSTFFNGDDSINVIKENILKAIGKEE